MGQTPPGKSPSLNRNAATVVGLRVRFELGARDGLRRVVFAMEKSKTGNGSVQWVVEFQLYERGTRAAKFEQLAYLRVELDTRQHARAADVAARGLSDSQAARAVGPAADDARAMRRGELDQKEAHASVRGIVR